MGDMSLTGLAQDLKDSLHGSADAFTAANDGDFKRIVQTAAQYMHQIRPLIKRGKITLVAGTYDYAAPSDIVRVKTTQWGREARQQNKPWHSNFPKVTPKIVLIEDSSGRFLEVKGLPTASDIVMHGSACQYYYTAQHLVSDTAADTTVRAEDRALLLLRAQAEVCLELNLKGLNRPLSINDGIVKKMRSGSPAILAERLIALWQTSAQRMP